MTVDHIDDIVTEELEGLVVRKDLADKFRGRFSVPTYVGEFLIGKYCATSDEDEIQEGLEQVEDLLSRRVVRTGDHELFKAKAREQGSIQIIDLIRRSLDRDVDPDFAAQRMETLMPGRSCNGYWHGKPGLEQIAATNRN